MFTRYYPNQAEATGLTRAEIGQVKVNESVNSQKLESETKERGLIWMPRTTVFEWYHGCGSKVEICSRVGGH